ncbi:TBC1 domain family member 22B [Dissostichus eleginoides]|uniref:TBC1 domain family member 22B n=1 Tax=Dissostichus eleginoides TaxID=100907 RepID=A0AAD9CRG7_DISEL|nr:TBC1 domain family member 22B [Dissostichus eleginoides]
MEKVEKRRNCDREEDNYTFAQPGIQRKVKALEELVSRIDATCCSPLWGAGFAGTVASVLNFNQHPHNYATQHAELGASWTASNESVHRHMQQYEVEYLQFAFRWMNNLLMRELPLRCTIRLWDTYQNQSQLVVETEISRGVELSRNVLQVLGVDSMNFDSLIDRAEPEGFSHFHLYVCAAFLVRWRKEILEERDFQGQMILLQNLPTMHWGNEEVSVLLAEAYRLKFAFADAPNHYKR